MSNLTPQQIIAWCREQAAKYSAMAEQLERDFGLRADITSRSSMNPEFQLSSFVQIPRTVDASQIRPLLTGKKVRVTDIAQRLGTTPDAIRPLLTAENGFEVGTRGWISLKGENS